MTQEPKLLTEAEAEGAWKATYSTHAKSLEDYKAELRERGLIAAEPVDPLLEEAREVVAKWAEGIEGFGPYADDYRSGKRDKDSEIQTCISALRRGIEISAERLTREMVRDAYFNSINMDGASFPDRIYAALTEMMNGEG
jgi:hypothetical protein